MNANQVKFYTYPDLLKENPLLKQFLNSESTANFLDETFYHTHTLLFSMTVSAAIVIKAIIIIIIIIIITFILLKRNRFAES